MNIFVLNENPKIAAQDCVDKHCVKMVLELYQQLGSAVRRHGAVDDQMPLTKKGTPLKGGYHNHPCTRWCGDSRENFKWAATHALALAKEYTFRYGRQHACEDGIRILSEMADLVPDGELTPFAQAMPDEFQNPDAVQAYRDYYFHDKRKNIDCSWKKGRPSPRWWREMEQNN